MSSLSKYCLYAFDKDIPTWNFKDYYDNLEDVIIRIRGIVKHHSKSNGLRIILHLSERSTE